VASRLGFQETKSAWLNRPNMVTMVTQVPSGVVLYHAVHEATEPAAMDVVGFSVTVGIGTSDVELKLTTQ
jgi:hypothetical protein